MRTAALFRDLIDGPDVEDTEVIEKGENRDHADRGDQVFVVGAKAAAIAAHVKSLICPMI